jgi:ferrous iron transport protein A
MAGKKGKINGRCFANRLRNCFGRSPCNSELSKLSLGNRGGRGGRVKVCKVKGDRKVCARMASMGLYPGVEADIVCSGGAGQCVLKINGGTICIDADVIDNVYVQSI